ncbi:MAG: Co2+/Mg2+ efflux protein ApaG [Saprospiraceae bacterium]|nr:Co2+/Mg2+ efflux protein ApaG [Saprospiraceae bacterium]
MENPRIYTQTSSGIQISVVPKFISKDSNPAIGKFIFPYDVEMVNTRKNTVKLLNRHWFIYESILIKREVKGEGVVGVQPEIAPGESFHYTSWCPINSSMGKMVGKYEFIDEVSKEKFSVQIPEFILTADFILN